VVGCESKPNYVEWVTANELITTYINHKHIELNYCKTLIFRVHLIFANFASSIKSRN